MIVHGRESAVIGARMAWVRELPGVRAGSALIRQGEELLVVQDDAWSLARVRLPDLSVVVQPFLGQGGPLRKRDKPDFEAGFLADDGDLYLLGSGSRANRCTVMRIAADARIVTVHAAPELYSSIQAALQLDHRPNIEAAVVCGANLRLFHRGAGASASGSVELLLPTLLSDQVQVRANAQYELGELDGVALHITDAALAGPGRIAILAVAENTDDAVRDGAVMGSVFGLLECRGGHGSISWTRILEPDGQATRRKLEGLAMDDDLRGAWVISDPDDQQCPAQLCRVELRGVG